jgi:arylsulfatase A-like enzyme
MNRRGFLKTAPFLAGGLLHSEFCAGAAKRPPNVVFILIDDLGWTDLTCYGSRYFETPNVDRLASQGMRFTSAYSACAVCSPTRAAILTGRYPTRHGITDWIRARFQGGVSGPAAPQRSSPTVKEGRAAERRGPTVREGSDPQRSSPTVKEGMSSASDYESTPGRPLLTPRNRSWMELSEITIAEALKAAGYATCHVGKWHLGTDDFYPDKQGFDFNIGGCDYGQPPSYFDPYENKKGLGIPTLKPRRAGEYLTDREADEAARFIANHRDRPFFLYFADYAVHTPLMAKPDLLARYKAKAPANQKNPTYAAMIQSMDEAVGRVLKAIDENGLADNTVVVFTSDNGGLLGSTHNAPLRAGKGYPYEGGIRVPLIVRWPGVTKAGAVCDVPAISVDYFPTIAAAAGAPLPADRSIDGVNLMPALNQSGGVQRDALYWHFPHYRGNDVAPYSIIRAGDWKLIKHYEGKPFELFNLREDLSESNDLAGKEPDRVRTLDARLAAWLKDTGAKLPVPNTAPPATP